MKEEYWPRLLKESKKMHFLKTDFDKVRGIHSGLTMCLRKEIEEEQLTD